MTPIKVLIADDHKMFRDGMRAILHEEPEIEITQEASNGLEAVRKVAEGEIDVILMDIDMPEMNGIEATQFLKEEYPDIKILTLSMSDDEINITKMLQAGALGYILKNTGKSELVAAIKTVNSGDSYFSKEVSKKLFEQLSRSKKESQKSMSGSDGHPLLTDREIEILKLIAEEHTNTEIAERLFISTRTVDTHRRNLMQKLNVKNTAGLVKYAVKHQII